MFFFLSLLYRFTIIPHNDNEVITVKSYRIRFAVVCGEAQRTGEYSMSILLEERFNSIVKKPAVEHALKLRL